jgi:tight adherence protein B
MPAAFWIGRLAGLCTAVSLVAIGFALIGSQAAPGQRATRAYLDGFDRDLRFVRSSLRGRHVLPCQIAAVVGATVAMIATGTIAPAPVAVLALVGPSVWLARRVASRVTRIAAQIEPWLSAIANALEASPSLGEAIVSTLPLIPSPISAEVDLVVKETDLGTPLDQALDHFAERVPSATLAGAVLALRVARRSGGDLPAMLQSAAASLREMARLEGVVRTRTAEGKAQTFVIGALPVPMVLLIHFIDPRFFDPLERSLTGQLIVAAAIVLWVLAIVWARKILDVDI